MALETNGIIITGNVNDPNENNVATIQLVEQKINQLKNELNNPPPPPKPNTIVKVVYKNVCNADNYEKDYVFNRFNKINKKDNERYSSGFMRFHYGC